MRTGRDNRTEHGFTLIEVLVSLALVSIIVVMVLAAVQGSVRAIESAQRKSREVAIGSVQFALRGLLAEARPFNASQDPFANTNIIEGGPGQLTFVTSFAPGGQYGGLHTTLVAAMPSQTPGTYDLVVEQTVLRASGRGATVLAVDPHRATILKDIAGFSLGYFGRPDREGKLGWYGSWVSANRLPSLVQVDVRFPPGDGRTWPPLVVAIRMAN